MARVPLNRWLQVVASVQGPDQQRDRHVAHVLAGYMRSDGAAGCFPGQRELSDATAMNRRTIAASIERLRASGFLDVEARPVQYGRMGCRYFPALPDSLIGASMSAPMRKGIGAPRVHQSATQYAPANGIGAGSQKIGALSENIGASRVHQNPLPEISTEGAASPVRAEARSAAQDSLEAEAWRLKSAGEGDLSIGIKLNVSPGQAAVLARKGAQA